MKVWWINLFDRVLRIIFSCLLCLFGLNLIDTDSLKTEAAWCQFDIFRFLDQFHSLLILFLSCCCLFAILRYYSKVRNHIIFNRNPIGVLIDLIICSNEYLCQSWCCSMSLNLCQMFSLWCYDVSLYNVLAELSLIQYEASANVLWHHIWHTRRRKLTAAFVSPWALYQNYAGNAGNVLPDTDFKENRSLAIP